MTQTLLYRLGVASRSARVALAGALLSLPPAVASVAAPVPAMAVQPMLPGMAQAQCAIGERGPALIVEVGGLKDRQGLLRAELYPASDTDFLRDDHRLLAEGKTFRRVEMPATASRLCIKVPRPGRYALVVLHDRNADRRFNVTLDGVGFAGNPRLGWNKPAAAAASVIVDGLTHTRVVLMYRRGLFMRPLR